MSDSPLHLVYVQLDDCLHFRDLLVQRIDYFQDPVLLLMEVWECGGITSGVFLGFFDDHYCAQKFMQGRVSILFFLQSLKKLGF